MNNVKTEFKHISIDIEPEIGCEIYLSEQNNAEDDFNEDSPYFLIQCHFEEPDIGSCYVETHLDDLSGHYKFKNAVLKRNVIILQTKNEKHSKFEIFFF